MKKNHCVFPFGTYTFVTSLYAVFLGLSGLYFSQVGRNVIVGYLGVLGYWFFCQLQIISEKDVFYLFPIIKGEVHTGKVWLLTGIDVVLMSSFPLIPKFILDIDKFRCYTMRKFNILNR